MSEEIGNLRDFRYRRFNGQKCSILRHIRQPLRHSLPHVFKRPDDAGRTKMPKKDKLSKSDKKMLTKAGKKALKKAGKKPVKGQKVARSNVSLI
jgi:hypothetical protein